MHRFHYIIFFLLFAQGNIFAQGSYNPKELNNSSKGIIYDRALVGELQLSTNGLSLGVDIAKLKTYYKSTFYHIGIGELKHPKEYKNREDLRTSTTQQNSRSYIFGKKNSLYALRVGMGVKKYISEKARRKGLAIGFRYEAGPTLGLLKPYYLQVKKTELNTTPLEPVSAKYSEDISDVFLDNSLIFGASSFVKGINEIKVRPGIHAKAGLHFDWGAFDEYVKAMEVGVMADVFFGNVDLMIDEGEATVSGVTYTLDPKNINNQPFFINLYVSILLGKRW